MEKETSLIELKQSELDSLQKQFDEIIVKKDPNSIGKAIDLNNDIVKVRWDLDNLKDLRDHFIRVYIQEQIN